MTRLLAPIGEPRLVEPITTRYEFLVSVHSTGVVLSESDTEAIAAAMRLFPNVGERLDVHKVDITIFGDGAWTRKPSFVGHLDGEGFHLA